MTIPSHCFDPNKPIGPLLTAIKEEYDNELINSHIDRDQEDWNALNEDFSLTIDFGYGTFALDRPDNDASFFTSELYENYIQEQEPSYSILAIQERIEKAQNISDRLGLGLGNFNDLSQIEIRDLISTPVEDLVDRVEAEVNPDILIEAQNVFDRLGNAVRFSDTLVCPANLKSYVDELYIDSVIEFFKARSEQKLRAGTSGGSFGFLGTTSLSALGFEDLAREQLEKAAARLRKKISSEFVAEKRLLQEQCFILSQVNTLINYKRSNFVNRLPYVESTRIISEQSAPRAGTSGRTLETGASGRTLETVEVPVAPANAPILIQGDPFAFMNKLVQYPTTIKLFNLTTAQLSSLVPTIRLYKIATDPKTGKDIGEVEVTFDTTPAAKSYNSKKESALDLFKNKKKRGYGVGLKDFDFTFHGSDPFAAKKAINAKLSIFATSFGDLIQERNGYKYADLALKTGRTPKDIKKNLAKIEQQNLDKLNFRLKAVVGWAIPATNVGNFISSEKDAINDSFITLNLTPTVHEFNFDEMGGVNFVINYLAYIEDYFNQSTFNIFSDPDIERTRIARKLFFEYLDTQNCDEESLNVLKEASASVMEQEKSKSFRTILKKMRKNERILNYNISDVEIEKFLQTGKISDPKKLEPSTLNSANQKTILGLFKTYNSVISIENKRKRVIELTKSTREQNILSFFYISDLLDVIMDNIEETLDKLTSQSDVGGINYLELLESSGFIFDDDEMASRVQGAIKVTKSEYEPFLNGEQIREFKKSLIRAKEQYKKLRIVLGPVEVVNPFDRTDRIFCSIGDIPLSLNYFTEFLTQKMLAKQEVFYPLTNFVKDLVNEVIKNFLNNDSCFDFSIRQKLKLNSTAITAFKSFNSELDDLTYRIVNQEAKSPPLLETSGPSRNPIVRRDVNKEINYYIFYAGRTYPVDYMTGNEKIDSANGIYHYVLGKDRGIVKNISLNKTDMKGLKELRFEKEGFDGLTQLREVYNADIECFLNVQAYPGMYIYVDPRGFSPEAGINYSQFGIGGYYMITRAEHSIGVGKADTKIIAKWVADTNGRIDGSVINKDTKPQEEQELVKQKKCVTKARRNSFGASVNQNFEINSVFDLYKLTTFGAAYSLGKAIADTDK